MKAIIMAGGEGTRLRPLTSNRPKPMIPIINKPVLEHAVNLLRQNGFTSIAISLFYLPENVQNYFGDGSDWNVNISYSVEETPLGTAGGVRKAAGDISETIVVLSGDGVVDFDIGRVLQFHREMNSPFTIVLTRVKIPTEYGIVITREDGTIDKFLEKPAWSEVFSDTVNTGMYIIEPHIIRDLIPDNYKFDFSLDLFPLMKEKNIPLYGFISDGYWCDVGSLNAYREVHQAILEGKVMIEFPGKKIGDNVWAGRSVEISPGAQVTGPVILGNFVRVKPGAVISEFTVIGDNCVVEENATVKRSIILHNTFVGPRAEVRGAIIGKRCVLEEGVSVYEGAVISDDCEIGRSAEIPPGIRIWPEKIIEPGTRLTTDLIWGQTEKKTLFGADGIHGSFNVKINPEFAAKLGSAIGAHLGKNASVIVSRDATTASRLIKRSLSAGLLSMGVNVYDMEIEPIPINRYSIRHAAANMGIYVQISPMTGMQFILIRLYDRFGYQISAAEEKKIENIFFRGDYPRTNAFEVGNLVYPIHHLESYTANARNYIDHALLTRIKWNVMVDCFYGATAHVFPDLLADFGCTVTVLRGQIKVFSSERELKDETRKAIDNVVKMARANREIGVIIGPHGEYIIVIDERGNILTDDDISALLCVFYLKYKNEKSINVPVTTSGVIDRIASPYGAAVRRTSTRLRAIQDVADIFSPESSGRYPYLEREYDPMIVFLRLLEFASLEGKTLHELVAGIPKSNLYRTSVPCTIGEKALIMRALSSKAGGDGTVVEMIEGIRIIREAAWILVLPDAVHPLIHLYAEGASTEQRDLLIEEFAQFIKNRKAGP